MADDVATAGIGHNRGPSPDDAPGLYLREVGKLQAIEAVLRDRRYNQTQALVLIGLIVRSNKAYANAYPGGATLAIYAKVKRTDAVFDALRELEDRYGVIERRNRGKGQSNSYTVMPQRVVDAVVEQYEALKEAKTARALAATHPPDRGDLRTEPTRLNGAGHGAT
jgi:hypothetical protein